MISCNLEWVLFSAAQILDFNTLNLKTQKLIFGHLCYTNVSIPLDHERVGSMYDVFTLHLLPFPVIVPWETGFWCEKIMHHLVYFKFAFCLDQNLPRLVMLFQVIGVFWFCVFVWMKLHFSLKKGKKKKSSSHLFFPLIHLQVLLIQENQLDLTQFQWSKWDLWFQVNVRLEDGTSVIWNRCC